MRQSSNQRIVNRFRFTALCVLLKWILVTGSAPLMTYALFFDRRDLGLIAVALMGGAVLLSIGHWIAGVRARCPMCLMQVFSHQQQSKSRLAHHFLGSYRFFVALGVLFRGWFHCPYCGANTTVRVQRKGR